MAKVTSKLQVTIPKAIADAYGIRPGMTLDWVAAGESIRVTTCQPESPESLVTQRLGEFDAATERQTARQAVSPPPAAAVARGWTREDLYERGRAG